MKWTGAQKIILLSTALAMCVAAGVGIAYAVKMGDPEMAWVGLLPGWLPFSILPETNLAAVVAMLLIVLGFAGLGWLAWKKSWPVLTVGFCLLILSWPIAGTIRLELFERSFEASTKPHAIKQVDPAAWAKLHVGMSKKEVIQLLGDSESKGGVGVMQIGDKKVTPPEIWEYNWTDGWPLFDASEKAYAVYFDAAGIVTDFKEPGTKRDSIIDQMAKESRISPTAADLVVLCRCRTETNRVSYIIQEVWKGQRYLPPEFMPEPVGKVLSCETRDPQTEYPQQQLMWYRRLPGSTNILTHNALMQSATVESRAIGADWPGATSKTVSLRQLRKQITP